MENWKRFLSEQQVEYNPDGSIKVTDENEYGNPRPDLPEVAPENAQFYIFKAPYVKRTKFVSPDNMKNIAAALKQSILKHLGPTLGKLVKIDIGESKVREKNGVPHLFVIVLAAKSLFNPQDIEAFNQLRQISTKVNEVANDIQYAHDQSDNFAFPNVIYYNQGKPTAKYPEKVQIAPERYAVTAPVSQSRSLQMGAPNLGKLNPKSKYVFVAEFGVKSKDTDNVHGYNIDPVA